MPHRDELAAQRAANESLEAELQRCRAELASLGAELQETNQGVVALYAELDDKAEQLRQATELKSRFLSYVSHEFRTPLGAIRSLARILLDRLDGPLAPEQEKQVALIQTSAVELSGLVDDLLDLAKIEAGRITVSPAWFDLLDLFSALRGMFRPLLLHAATDLVFEEPDRSLRLYSDDRKVAQILRNFISNALKFTERGEVRVSARRSGGEVVFSVRDTGIGIAPHDLQRLFADFEQVAGPAQRRVHGTGLGLSLSKRLAQVLGGRVDAESEPGVGSTFYLFLPQRHPEQQGRSCEREASADG